MPWKKGQSGNPGGRTKEYMRIRDLAQKASPAAFKALTLIVKNGKTEAGRIQASNAILDRAFGKPAHTYTGEGGFGPITAELKVTFVDNEQPGSDEPDQRGSEPAQSVEDGSQDHERNQVPE